MSLAFLDNIDYKGKKPDFQRQQFDTIANMKAFSDNYLPETYIATCIETGKVYLYDKTNEVDETTGKWRELAGDSATKLSEDLTANAAIGFIAEGTTYEKGTSFEQIFIDLISGKTYEEDDFYYGASDTQEIISLYQFTSSTKSSCSVVANNQYIIFAVKKDMGELMIQDSNGFGYNNDFTLNVITHNGIEYNTYIGKYKITTSTTGFEYKLSLK